MINKNNHHHARFDQSLKIKVLLKQTRKNWIILVNLRFLTLLLSTNTEEKLFYENFCLFSRSFLVTLSRNIDTDKALTRLPNKRCGSFPNEFLRCKVWKSSISYAQSFLTAERYQTHALANELDLYVYTKTCTHTDTTVTFLQVV
jgi:hypothetical protein